MLKNLEVNSLYCVSVYLVIHLNAGLKYTRYKIANTTR